MGTLAEDLTSIKNVEDTLVANKVARFSYTDTAYTNNDANGVDTYDFNHEQNIPNPTTSVLKVNSTVLDKGYRSQASSITRMLVNHFFGRVSYNLNKINDNMSSLIATLRSHSGTANGFATLDSNGRIPYSQLPESAVELKGYWNAQTNTPTLADGTGTNGDEYFVDTAGSQDLGSGEQYFKVGDRVVYTGGVWKNIDSGSVRTINNQAPDNMGDVKAVLGENIPMSDDMILQNYAYDMLQTRPLALEGELRARIKKIQGHWYSYDNMQSNSRISPIGLRSIDDNIEAITSYTEMQVSSEEKVYVICIEGDENSTIVAVGIAPVANKQVGTIYVSHDKGEHWSKVYELPPYSNLITNHEFDSMLAYGNGVWIVNFGGNTLDSGGNTGCLISSDGDSWSIIPLPDAVLSTNVKLCKYCPYGNFFILSTQDGKLAKVRADINNPTVTIFGSASSGSNLPHDWCDLVFNEHIIWGLGNVCAYSTDEGETWTTALSSNLYGGFLTKNAKLFLPDGTIYWNTTDESPSSRITLYDKLDKIGNCFVSTYKHDNISTHYDRICIIVGVDFTSVTYKEINSKFSFYPSPSDVNRKMQPYYITQILADKGNIYALCEINTNSGRYKGMIKFSVDTLKADGMLTENVILQ